MTEILTESFCERCGTRYTFESTVSRPGRLSGVRVLGRGIRNFVMSDDSSLDEAFAAARSDSEREFTALQLDAFHTTFNFCMSCRQYTCGTCWNESEARCLSCKPLDGSAAEAQAVHVHVDRLEAFAGGPPVAAPTGEMEAEPFVETEDELEAEPVAVVEPRERRIGGLAAGQSLGDAIAAYEASLAAEAAELDVVAAQAAERDDTAAAAAGSAAAPAIPVPLDAPVPADEPTPAVEELPAAVPQPLPPATPAAPPMWPTGPRWPTAMPARPSTGEPETAAPPSIAASADPLAALIARTSTDAMWAASSRELALSPAPAHAPVASVQSCANCGLALSATARFCRRCGTAQG